MSRQPSCAWAFKLDATPVGGRELSDGGDSGLDYARELAGDARTRSNANLRGYNNYPPLTIADLAERDQIPAATIRAQIKTARRELFGNLSDSGIYKRVQRQNRRRRRSARRCKHKDCERQLPSQIHANRCYCDEHRTAAERVRRHRQQTR